MREFQHLDDLRGPQILESKFVDKSRGLLLALEVIKREFQTRRARDFVLVRSDRFRFDSFCIGYLPVQTRATPVIDPTKVQDQFARRRHLYLRCGRRGGGEPAGQGRKVTPLSSIVSLLTPRSPSFFLALHAVVPKTKKMLLSLKLLCRKPKSVVASRRAPCIFFRPSSFFPIFCAAAQKLNAPVRRPSERPTSGLSLRRRRFPRGRRWKS